jgi:hypothetical protein
MHEINFLDETFVKNQTHHYHMSIQTGLNGLSFSILDLQNLKYVVLRNYYFDNVNSADEVAAYFSAIIQKDDLLQLKYKSVSHIYIGSASTLIPAAYFDASHISRYYKLNFSSSDHCAIMYNVLDSGNIFNVFSYPETLQAAVNTHFPQSKLFHHSSAFLENIIKESAHLVKPRCFVYLYKGILNIAIADHKKLQFYNTFIINSVSDVIYYITSVYDQFQMSPKHSELFISSDTDEHDEIFEQLYKYYNGIRFITPSKQFTYSYLFDELYLTRYANLFNLALCE